MSRREKLEEIRDEVYREMFLKSTPRADYDMCIKTGEAKKSSWFMKYYLDQEVQDDIIDNHLKRHQKLTVYELRTLRTELHLGCAPCGSLAGWKKHNNQSGLEEFQ